MPRSICFLDGDVKQLQTHWRKTLAIIYSFFVLSLVVL